MMLSGHVAVTTISLHYLADPAAIIAANLVAHPVLDAVPHVDWATVWDRPHGKAIGIALTALDLVVGGYLIVLMLERVDATPAVIVGAVTAGLWLDLIDPLTRRWSILAPLRRFHLFCHAWPDRSGHDHDVDWPNTVTGRVPDWVKLAIQASLVAVAVRLLT
ncbi:hypothetical protein HY374_00820 [Candidatus Berkelbacteria bacterium]|nr:hypothetical protein [Candidatus Berkelbacteria bacterium]